MSTLVNQPHAHCVGFDRVHPPQRTKPESFNLEDNVAHKKVSAQFGLPSPSPQVSYKDKEGEKDRDMRGLKIIIF